MNSSNMRVLPTPFPLARKVAFGYILADPYTHISEVERLEVELRAFAEERGHCVVAVFVEHPGTATSVFAVLMNELHNTSSDTVVIVPELRYLARIPSLQTTMQYIIEEKSQLLVMNSERFSQEHDHASQ